MFLQREEPKISILIEGCDASGKTSLARLIMKLDNNITYYASGGPPQTRDDMIRFCEDQLLLASKNRVIIDRATPISHVIYNSEKLSFQDVEYLADMCDEILRQPQCILVYCRPCNEHLLNPKSHEWKEYDTPEHIEKVLNNQARYIATYDQFMGVRDHIHCDFDETDNYIELAALLAAAESSTEARNKLRQIGRVRHG